MKHDHSAGGAHSGRRARSEVVRPAGFEPATTRLEGGCSIQLSYGRVHKGCGARE